MPRFRMTPPGAQEDVGRSDGDVLGNELEAVLPVEGVGDEFEAIVPSSKGRLPGPQPAEGDEFEDILPSGAGLAKSLADDTLLQQAQIETEEANESTVLGKSGPTDKVAQKRCCGFTLGQFLRMLGSIFLPVADAASDWVVTLHYAQHQVYSLALSLALSLARARARSLTHSVCVCFSGMQEYTFLGMSIGIQLVMGMILGWMLAEELEERAEHRSDYLPARHPAAAAKLPPCPSLWGALNGSLFHSFP
jgi:hypothetical protein